MGVYLDGRSSPKADFAFTSLGLLIASTVSFGFIFATQPWHVYVLQAVHSVGLAMNFSGFSGLFTRNIDKGRESTEQGIDSTVVSIGTAVSAIAGGWIVLQFGYPAVFILVGILGLLGWAALFFIKDDLERNSGHGLYFNFKELLQKGLDNRA